MNKVKVAIAVIFFSLVLAMVLTNPTSKPDQALEELPMPTAEVAQTKVLQNSKIAFVYWAALPSGSSLIANFDSQENAGKLLKEKGCDSGINGSFYDDKYEPLAWWEVNSVMRKKVTHNNLLNGFVSVNVNNDLDISKTKSDQVVRWGMQSGPVLMLKGLEEELQMAIDKPARRSVIAKDKTGRVVILSIFGSESKLDGPTLAQMPKIVKAISDQEKLELVDAINLDGGAASVFVSPKISIPEMVLVGSVICLKN